MGLDAPGGRFHVLGSAGGYDRTIAGDLPGNSIRRPLMVGEYTAAIRAADA